MSITFSNFLVEEDENLVQGSRLKAIERKEAVLLARRKCKNFLNANEQPSIVRGISSYPTTGYGVGDPKKAERVSRNTTNEYTLLMSNLDVWKKYPKRSQSFICSNFAGLNTASGYGKPFAVIPFDNAKIGVCGAHDLWFSFEFMTNTLKADDVRFKMLDEFNGYLRNIIERITKKSPDEMNFSKLMQTINKSEAIIRARFKGKEFGERPKSVNRSDWLFQMDDKDVGFMWTLMRYPSFEEAINALFDPKKNGFKLANEKSIAKYANDKRRELWTDSECIFVKIYDDDEWSDVKAKTSLGYYNKFRKAVLGN